MKKLLKGIKDLTIINEKPLENLTGLTCDYKLCQPDFLYAALTGETVDSEQFGEILDGRAFIPNAIANGATVILTDENGFMRSTRSSDVTYLISANPNEAFAKIAANFFAFQPEHSVCVTGTNGKTSTVNFCRQLWYLLGQESASIGNLGTIAGDDRLLWRAMDPFSVPETVALYQMQRELVEQKVKYVALEATSHALFEHRLSGIDLSIAAFTSFSRDHLDFHLTMENYFNIKMKLFTEVLKQTGTAVICADMNVFEQMDSHCQQRGLNVISYGYQGKDIQLLALKETLFNQQMTFRVYDQVYQVNIPFPGEYQTLNLLCAIGILSAQGFSINDIVLQIPKLQFIPGRMEKVAEYNGGQIFLDYAHTDDALAIILKDLKALTTGRIGLVFGAAGNRDAGKRTLMGKVAAEYADWVVITDDDPRDEDPAVIRETIASACPGAYNMANRKDAIYFAIKKLQKDDVLIIAGKGPDDVQVIGQQKIQYNDYDAVYAALLSLSGSTNSLSKMSDLQEFP